MPHRGLGGAERDAGGERILSSDPLMPDEPPLATKWRPKEQPDFENPEDMVKELWPDMRFSRRKNLCYALTLLRAGQAVEVGANEDGTWRDLPENWPENWDGSVPARYHGASVRGLRDILRGDGLRPGIDGSNGKGPPGIV